MNDIWGSSNETNISLLTDMRNSVSLMEHTGDVVGLAGLFQKALLYAGPHGNALLLRVAGEAMEAIGRINNEKSFSFLTHMVGQDFIWKKPVVIGWSIVGALKSKRDSRAVKYLVPLLKSKYHDARMASSDALAELGGELARKALVNAIKKEKNGTTRVHMQEALKRIESSMPLESQEPEHGQDKKNDWWRFWQKG